MQAAVLADESWLDDAVATIAGLAQHQDIVTAEDLAREMRKPPHDKMPGLAFTKAKNAGLIEWVRYVRSTTKTRKGGSVSEWRRKQGQEQS